MTDTFEQKYKMPLDFDDLKEAAKDGYSAGFEVARAFYKEAVRTLRDNARLGADMSDYIVRSVDLHALEVVSQLEAEKEIPLDALHEAMGGKEGNGE